MDVDKLIKDTTDEIGNADRTCAKLFHTAFMGRLVKRGLKVQGDYPINRADGRKDRIDVVFWTNEGKPIAVEIDNTRPRSKSVEKLKRFGGGYVILRDPTEPTIKIAAD